MNKPCLPTEHFLPDFWAWGDVSSKLEAAITVPIRRVKKVQQWTGDPPFYVYGCSWWHLDRAGPLTQEKFNKDLDGAIADFAADMNRHEAFLAYPITYEPPQTLGRAFHDWIGAAYPFDLRAVIDYDTHIVVNPDDITSGLKFHLLTAISRESKYRGD